MKGLIGITGGIASGKSNVSNVIRGLGYKVLSCDSINALLIKKGNACYNAIIKEFGNKYLDKNLEIDKALLAADLFSNPAMKEKINSLAHPLIMDKLLAEAKASEGIVFAEIPLLYEGKYEYLCNSIICVYLDYDIQLKRLMEREGINEAYASKKINSQMPLIQKKKLANYIIDSKGTFEETKEQVLNIIEQIRKEF